MIRREFFDRLQGKSTAPQRGAVSVQAPTPPLNISAGLEPYGEVLTQQTAAHLLRRSGYGASKTRADELTGMSPGEAVDEIVDAALSLPLPEPPPWANSAPPNPTTMPTEFEQYLQDNNEWALEYRYSWTEELFSGGLRERLALFWHDHFVTNISAYILSPFAVQYLTMLRTHCLGDFKQFVFDVGVDPGMLVYLNGTDNEAGAPNENYARELLELFTMGQERNDGTVNYTQGDIEEIARALTGWKTDYFGLTSVFNPFPGSFFDDTDKTIFGLTGNYGYSDVIDIVFNQRADAIAEFICRKIYREFVYDGADEQIVADLALIFKTNDFQIEPVVRTLLKSAHFFDSQVIGARVKTPVELLTGILVESEASLPEGTFSLAARICFFLEQILLNPPSVEGWKTHHAWISTTSFPIRWLVPDFILTGGTGIDLLDLIPLAEKLYDPQSPLAAFYLPLALAEYFIPVPVSELDIQPIDGGFAGDLVNNPIPQEIENGPEYVKNLAKAFLGGTPWYEWFLYQDNANLRIFVYLRYLLQTPEYQLT
ncbi:MAG: DUF1800 domain-containing protein [Rhodothermales bacterium]|nr:DUF1800 domain-containing protein [Rhodothermales bacterium]